MSEAAVRQPRFGRPRKVGEFYLCCNGKGRDIRELDPEMQLHRLNCMYALHIRGFCGSAKCTYCRVAIFLYSYQAVSGPSLAHRVRSVNWRSGPASSGSKEPYLMIVTYHVLTSCILGPMEELTRVQHGAKPESLL